MEVLSHLQIILTGSGILITVIVAGLKFIDSRFTKNERLAEDRNVKLNETILGLTKSVAEASGANVTMTDCVVNSRRAEDKWEKAIAEAEARGDVKIGNLDKRLDKLESKIF